MLPGNDSQYQTFRPLNKTLSLNSSKGLFMLGRHNYVALIKRVKDRDAAELPPRHKTVLHNKESFCLIRQWCQVKNPCSPPTALECRAPHLYPLPDLLLMRQTSWGTGSVELCQCCHAYFSTDLSSFCSRPTFPHVTTCPTRPWSDPMKLPELSFVIPYCGSFHPHSNSSYNTKRGSHENIKLFSFL